MTSVLLRIFHVLPRGIVWGQVAPGFRAYVKTGSSLVALFGIGEFSPLMIMVGLLNLTLTLHVVGEFFVESLERWNLLGSDVVIVRGEDVGFAGSDVLVELSHYFARLPIGFGRASSLADLLE